MVDISKIIGMSPDDFNNLDELKNALGLLLYKLSSPQNPPINEEERLLINAVMASFTVAINNEEARRAKVEELTAKYNDYENALNKFESMYQSVRNVLENPAYVSYAYTVPAPDDTCAAINSCIDYFRSIFKEPGISTIAEAMAKRAEFEQGHDNLAMQINNLNGIYDHKSAREDLQNLQPFIDQGVMLDSRGNLIDNLRASRPDVFNELFVSSPSPRPRANPSDLAARQEFLQTLQNSINELEAKENKTNTDLGELASLHQMYNDAMNNLYEDRDSDSHDAHNTGVIDFQRAQTEVAKKINILSKLGNNITPADRALLDTLTQLLPLLNVKDLTEEQITVAGNIYKKYGLDPAVATFDDLEAKLAPFLGDTIQRVNVAHNNTVAPSAAGHVAPQAGARAATVPGPTPTTYSRNGTPIYVPARNSRTAHTPVASEIGAPTDDAPQVNAPRFGAIGRIPLPQDRVSNLDTAVLYAKQCGYDYKVNKNGYSHFEPVYDANNNLVALDVVNSPIEKVLYNPLEAYKSALNNFAKMNHISKDEKRELEKIAKYLSLNGNFDELIKRTIALESALSSSDISIIRNDFSKQVSSNVVFDGDNYTLPHVKKTTIKEKILKFFTRDKDAYVITDQDNPARPALAARDNSFFRHGNDIRGKGVGRIAHTRREQRRDKEQDEMEP